MDGCPPGIALSEADIQPQLDRRRPGQSKLTHRASGIRFGVPSCPGWKTAKRWVPPIGLFVPNKDPASRGITPACARCRGAVARRLHLPDEVRHARFQRRRSVQRPGDHRTGGGRSHCRESAAPLPRHRNRCLGQLGARYRHACSGHGHADPQARWIRTWCAVPIKPPPIE